MSKIALASPNKSLKKQNRREMRYLTYFVLPGLILTIVFKYLPMFGIVIAFKEFNPNLGFLGSRWVGLQNFKFFFTSDDFITTICNTLGYSLGNMIVGNIISVFIAVLCYNVYNRGALKFYQTSVILPNFLSDENGEFIVTPIYEPLNIPEITPETNVFSGAAMVEIKMDRDNPVPNFGIYDIGQYLWNGKTPEVYIEGPALNKQLLSDSMRFYYK